MNPKYRIGHSFYDVPNFHTCTGDRVLVIKDITIKGNGVFYNVDIYRVIVKNYEPFLQLTNAKMTYTERYLEGLTLLTFTRFLELKKHK